MIIQTIGITGFRNHKETALKLAPGLNVFAGKRGRGKTGVCLAISSAFCFQNFLTTASGGGMDDQIATGAEGFNIFIKYVDANGRTRKLERALTVKGDERKHELSLSGYEGADRLNDKQIEVLRTLGVRREIALACFDVRTLRERSLEEQRAEVLAVIQKSSEQIAVEPPVSKLLKKWFDVDAIETLGEIAALYDKAVEKRKVKKRDQDKAQPGVAPENRPKKTAAEYVADQSTWSQDAAKHARRVGEIGAQLAAHERAVAKAKEPEMQEPPSMEPLEADTRAAWEIHSKAEAAHAAATDEWRRLKSIKQGVDADTAKAKKTCDQCGTTLSPKNLKQYSDRLATAIATLEMEGKGLAAKRDEASAALKAARDIEDRRKPLWKQYRVWQAGRTSAPEPIDVEALTAEKATAEEAQAKATRNQSKATELAALARTAEAYDAKVKTFDAGRLDLEELEWLCQVLGKDGIRKELFMQWATPFLAAMNEVTAPFGILCSLDVDLGIMANGRLPQALSQGDLLIFEVAYRRAIAKHSGLNVMCLDASERLPEQERDVLWDLLRKIGAEGVQVIATEATDIVRPGIFWFELKDGVTVVTPPDGSDPHARPKAA